ncbi:MAG: glycosyltransferase family 9 protein [Endomicrobiales bacterium]|nr:glycosyltransferase family 9 protein [Endomicrobiales bacterium]
MNKYLILKNIDNGFGSFLCAVLSAFHSRKKKAEIRKNPKVLIIKFWGMGSILLFAPAVKALKDSLAPEELMILTLESNREVCRSLGLFTDVLSCRLFPLHRFVYDLFRNILRLRMKKVDILFDFEFFTNFTAIVTFLIGARTNVGFYAHDLTRSNFYELTAPFNQYWHITDIYMNLANKVLDRQLDKNYVLPDTDDAVPGRYGLEKGKYIVINPNSEPISLERRWPREYFIELIEAIGGYGGRIALIGSAAEAEYNEQIIGKIAGKGNIVNLGGKTSFVELASVIKNAKLLITNDSGPLHVGVIFGTPTVSFFGPETPVIYGPKSGRHHVFFENVECSPCMNIRKAKEVKCKKGKADCILKITPDKVIKVVREFLV